MIVIRNFKEMVEQQHAGSVPIRIMQEIASVLLGLADYQGDIPEPLAITQQQINFLLNLPEDIEFMHYMGGNVFLCETESDLLQVTSMDIEFSKLHGRWPSCVEVVLAWDSATYLRNADGTADYSLLFCAANNAGGPSWFIPEDLWVAAQIDKQIEAHKQFWSVA